MQRGAATTRTLDASLLLKTLGDLTKGVGLCQVTQITTFHASGDKDGCDVPNIFPMTGPALMSVKDAHFLAVLLTGMLPARRLRRV
jgi:hypothetical protein